MYNKTYSFFVFVFVFSLSIVAQEKTLKYSKKLTISDGLAHNGVTSVLEDSRGVLWFGTYDGLNKYDGYEIQTFKNTINQDLLTSNRVRALAEDDYETLWIGTDEGVNIYDYNKEVFKKIYSNKLTNNGISGPIIRSVIANKNSKNILCLSEDGCVLVFNAKDYSLIGNYKTKSSFRKKVKILNGLQLDETNYLLATSIGLLNFNSESKVFKKILKNEVNSCNSIVKIDSNTLLITLSQGLALVNYSKDIGSFSFLRKDLSSYSFNSSMIDSLGKLWLGILNRGVLIIDNVASLKNNTNYDLEFFNDNKPALRVSSIASMSDNNCLVATFDEGLYEFDLKPNPFKNYNIEMDFKYGLKSNSVKHMAPLGSNKMYLTASFGGLTLFNTETQKFEPINFNLPGDENSRVSSVFVDSRENTWFRINGKNGLYRKVKNSSKLDVLAENLLETNVEVAVRAFTEDKYGNIWISTNDNVFRVLVNKDNKILKVESLNDNPFFSNKKLSLARYIYADPLYDFIWVGADSDGLFRIKNSKELSIEKLKVDQFIKNKANKFSISSNFVTTIIRLPNEDLWVGTEGGGMCKVLKSDTIPEFIPFTEKDGLSNNVVKHILYDDGLNLWISTNIGLNAFDTKSNEFRRFNVSDGLAFEDFWFAGAKLKNGMLAFSGIDGFIYFDPNKIINEESLPELLIENFSIFNKPIKPGDTINGRVLLIKTLSKVNEITLKHNENVFSLDLTSLHFSNPKNHNIKYKLSPINDDWVKVPSNQKKVSYSGLQAGEYELSVSASNSLNNWIAPKSLKITIKPSIWNTTWAYFLYCLVALLIAYAIGRVIFKIQALNHKVEIEQLEIDNVKEVNEAKLRFFANISHELKTPLTLISRPIEILSERFKSNSEIQEKLSLMSRQSKKIYQLIDQVHDFRRADANLLKMDYSRFSFDNFVKELTVDFEFLAENDQKNLVITSGESKIMVSADKDKLEKIFNNLLNNAFKYTDTNDTIEIKYESDDKDLIVSVIDTGKGIDSIDLEHIFERFYQSHKKQNKHITGSGIGLAFSKRLVEMHYGFISAESTLGEGTTIKVRLPIVKKYLPSDILDEVDLPKEKEVKVNDKLIKENSPAEITATGEFSESVIFYAEDNLEMRNFVDNLLSKYFKVKSFRNGKECFEALEDEWPDIVISDVQMPEMNGLDLCVRIKSDLKTSHIPVILLTALTNIEDHLKGIRDGADAYIKKPFNVQHLITNVEALLANRKQLRDRYQVGIPLTRENNKNNRNDNAFLEKLYSLMEENLDNQNFDLNGLAKELYLNRTHFYQKVKVLTNQTPFELLKIYRLKKAAEFLSQKKLSVNEVFVMTGFKSRTHFAKVFKEKYNISPGKYASETLKKYE